MGGKLVVVFKVNVNTMKTFSITLTDEWLRYFAEQTAP
ncbi:hypothetical protein HDC90_002113 [Pedobacter sp. AK013]|nr:hypothetical protein [Pedobacter sp. AK013]